MSSDRTVLSVLPDPLKPVFTVAYHIGTRKGELLKIHRDWIDFREGLVYINGRVTKNKTPPTAPIYGDMGGCFKWL